MAPEHVEQSERTTDLTHGDGGSRAERGRRKSSKKAPVRRRGGRFSVQFSESMESLLEGHAAEHGVSKNDIIRMAVTLYDYAEEERRRGNVLCVATPDHEIRKEIILVGGAPVRARS